MSLDMQVFFKMQQKDDKKEVLKFEIKGSDEANLTAELYKLAGSIVVFSIEGATLVKLVLNS